MAEKPISWQEIVIRRQLSVGAVLPPSQEQVDEAVARKQQKIAKENAFKDDLWDIQYDNLRKDSKAKNN